MSDSQRNEHGQWETAELLRRATWPEVLLDRWIGPRSGHPWTWEVVVNEATTLPEEVRRAVDDIAEDALQNAFARISMRLHDLGYPVTGDVAPDEAVYLDNLFRGFVRSMALNNRTIAELNSAPSPSPTTGKSRLQVPVRP